jgi:hypothetical protein
MIAANVFPKNSRHARDDALSRLHAQPERRWIPKEHRRHSQSASNASRDMVGEWPFRQSHRATLDVECARRRVWSTHGSPPVPGSRAPTGERRPNRQHVVFGQCLDLEFGYVEASHATTPRSSWAWFHAPGSSAKNNHPRTPPPCPLRTRYRPFFSAPSRVPCQL